MELSLPAAVTFSVYLLVMLGIGIWVYQRNKSLSDFVLGGRRSRSPLGFRCHERSSKTCFY